MRGQAFQTIKLRDLTVRNRVWVPPMCQYSAVAGDGVPTDWHLMHYGSYAAGGAGAIIVESTGVVPEGRISPQCLGIWNETQVAAFRRITDLVHGEGAAIGIQLGHSGRKGSIYPEWSPHAELTGKVGSVPVEAGGWQTVGPSAIPFADYRPPRELTVPEIADITSAFAAAAERAVRAGFDFIELHGAHGYLLHQFLSPLSNQRTDEYGGSFENRVRLLLQVVDAVRDVIPAGMPLLVRLSATDWTEGGLTADDTVEICRLLSDRGVDLVDVSTGGNVLAEIPVAPGYQVPFATRVKQELGIPVGAVGLLTTPEQVEQVIATGLADVVLIGREVQRNPSFPAQAAVALRAAEPPLAPQTKRAWNAVLRVPER